MFLRCTQREKDGKSHRMEPGGHRHPRRATGGAVTGRPWRHHREPRRARTTDVMKTPPPRFPSPPRRRRARSTRPPAAGRAAHPRPRQWGACWLSMELWQQLDLDRCRAATRPRGEARHGCGAQDAGGDRLIDRPGETHRHWFDASAMADVLRPTRGQTNNPHTTPPAPTTRGRRRPTATPRKRGTPPRGHYVTPEGPATRALGRRLATRAGGAAGGQQEPAPRRAPSGPICSPRGTGSPAVRARRQAAAAAGPRPGRPDLHREERIGPRGPWLTALRTPGPIPAARDGGHDRHAEVGCIPTTDGRELVISRYRTRAAHPRREHAPV